MKKMITCLLTLLMISFSVQSVSAYEPWIEEYLNPADHKIDMSNGNPETGDTIKYSNRYAAYLDVVEKCIEQFGETDCTEGPSYGTQQFIGLSFLKLVDFNEDGDEELMLVFNSHPKADSEGYRTRDYVYNIWGYDGKQPVLLQDGMGLFGSNGGIQTISFVKNPFGIFLRRGATDSFRYDFYYGYEAEKFGLCKSLVWQFDYTGDHPTQVYYADDKMVTESFYDSEKELWDGGLLLMLKKTTY